MFDQTLVAVGPAQREGEHLVVTVAGEIDCTSSDTLHTDVLALLEDGVRHLVLDFSLVTFCDSSGMSALIGIQRHLHVRGGMLVVASAPGNVSRALRLGGLDQLIPVLTDLAAAVEALPEATGTGQ